MKAFIGDYVQTLNHNHIGRVYAKHHNFDGVQENEQWFNMQSPALDPSTKKENWYSILCDKGGSVVVPQSQIKIAQTTPINGSFENMWEDHYFRI